MKWSIEHVFPLLSAIATVLGSWALIRTYILSRPELVLIRQHRWGKNLRIPKRASESASWLQILDPNRTRS
jgi:hypothetical protein